MPKQQTWLESKHSSCNNAQNMSEAHEFKLSSYFSITKAN